MDPARPDVSCGPVDKVVRQLAAECGDAVAYGHLVGMVTRCADDLRRIARAALDADPDDFAAVLEDLARGRLAAVAPPAPRSPMP